MHIFITGGCGFIGSNLAKYHLDKGDEVHVLDDLSTGFMKNIASFHKHPNFRLTTDNLLTYKSLDKAVSQADRIYHLAAVTGTFRIVAEPIKVLAINISASERLLRAINAATHKPHLILASSSAVYGTQTHDLLETDNLAINTSIDSHWNYAISKIASEAFALAYTKTCDLPITIARIFDVIGPGQTGRFGRVVPRLVEQAIQKLPLSIYGDGTQIKSFIHVQDLIEALNALAENPQSIGEIFNVGSDHAISINDLAKMICKLTGSNSTFHYLTYEQALSQSLPMPTRHVPKIDKLQNLTNFQLKHTLENSLTEVIEHMRKEFFEEVDS